MVSQFIWQHPANRQRRLRQLVRAGIFQATARTVRPRQTITYGSSILAVELHFPSSTRALYADPPDFSEMMAWRRLLHPGSLFVDVGANIGLYTVMALELGAAVIAIEPSAAEAERLAYNVGLNGAEAQIIRAAASSKPGVVRLSAGPHGQQHLGGGALQVEATTVDEVLGERHARGLKVDVEGAERQVLEGAERALREHRIDWLQLEWNQTSQKHFGETREPVAVLLASHGYGLYRPTKGGEMRRLEDLNYGPDVFAAPLRV